MISDLIDIKDAKVINIGFDFEFVVSSRYNRDSVMAEVNEKMISFFGTKLYIGEPIYITDIYQMINKTDGVVDTIKVRPKVMSDSDYSQLSIEIEHILSKDGTYIKTPSNCILEVKYPSLDIKGVIV